MNVRIIIVDQRVKCFIDLFRNLRVSSNILLTCICNALISASLFLCWMYSLNILKTIQSLHRNMKQYVLFYCRPWDIGDEVPRETPTPHEDFLGLLKVLRFFFCVFLFLAVWVSATISQLCLLTLTAALNFKVSIIA